MFSKIKKQKMKIEKLLFTIVFLAILCLISYISGDFTNNENTKLNNVTETSNKTTLNLSLEDIPEYTDNIYVEINNNKPYFDEKDYTTEPFETYSKLDEKGRCGVAYANICKEIMPVNGQVRESISKVKPTGWIQTKIDGEYLYNRCHLIGYQLAAENANELNLITGTKYFNVSGMLPFENKVASYIDENKNNHVLYRVTPIFKGDNLLASGVEIEAYSVEDNGAGVCFNIFVYNVSPGVEIDYKTGALK